MKIYFPVETNESCLYYGNKSRYSSMTSVTLITPNLLACASYCMKRLYLVSFDLSTQTYNILDNIETVAGQSDLMIYRNNELVTSNFENCSISFYEILENTKLFHKKTITNTFCGPCHGVSFYPSDDNVIVFTTTGTQNPVCGIYAIYCNSSNDTLPFFALSEKGWLGKDVTFVSENIMVALFCNSAPNAAIKRYYDTKIVVYHVDLKGNRSRHLTELVIDRHHGDSCKYKNGKLYVTVQSADDSTGKVLIFEIDKIMGNLTKIDELHDYNFPHGVDANDICIAVTEYGTSAVDIRLL